MFDNEIDHEILRLLSVSNFGNVRPVREMFRIHIPLMLIDNGLFR